MYVLVLISAGVVLYQYHLSNSWIVRIEVRICYKGFNLGHHKFLLQTNEISTMKDMEPVLPPLYIITPTYYRAEQLPELTRLSHTLMLIPNVHWLVIEDAQTKSHLVTDLLLRTGLKFDHLLAPMPEKYRKRKIKPRGVSNRNRGLAWLRANASNGVFYFADDDNTYDLELFQEVSYHLELLTKRFGRTP